MIEFPAEAETDWKIVADAANATVELRKRIARDTQVEGELEKLRVRYEAGRAFQQELDAEDTPDLEMLTLTNYQTNPTTAPRDMIEGVLKEDGLCIMLGASGSGKSTLALQFFHSVLTGSDWLGQKCTKISGSVGMLSYDMPGSMALDWMSGYPGVDPDRISVVNAYKRGNPLAVPDQRKQIAAVWQRMEVEVVVIDSFSASFFAHDQNDAGLTMAHYRDLKKFALSEVGAKAVVVIVHSTDSNPKKARGSTVHRDVADSIVSVVVDKQTDQRRIEMDKYRAGRGQAQMKPIITTPPDPTTNLCDVDPGAMSLAGLAMPVNSVSAFPALPTPTETPDTESDEGDDDL